MLTVETMMAIDHSKKKATQTYTKNGQRIPFGLLDPQKNGDFHSAGAESRLGPQSFFLFRIDKPRGAASDRMNSNEFTRNSYEKNKSWVD